MLIDYTLGQTSIILRVKMRTTAGLGMTGLSSASSGLVIGTIAGNEATSTAYTVAGSTIETITTLGTYATPTATKCRFKEVSSANHPGIYEIQIADARFAVASAKAVLISWSGVAGMADGDALIPLRSVNPYAASFGLVLIKGTNVTGFTDAAAGPSVTAIRAEMDANSTKLANLDASISSRSTYAGGVVAGVTAPVTVGTNNDKSGYGLSTAPPSAAAIRAEMDTNSTKLAFLDASISSRSTYAGGTVASVANPVTVGTNNDKAGYSIAGTKTTLDVLNDATAAPSAVAIRTEIDANSTQLAALVAGVTVTDKTGFALAPTGLDSITATAPIGVASTFPQMVVQTWWRLFRKTTRTTTQIKTFAADGTTVLTTQAITDDGAGNESQGVAS